MKGERLFVERQTELLEHLAEEKDITVKFNLPFAHFFSPKLFFKLLKNMIY